jgi:hypothetical protein
MNTFLKLVTSLFLTILCFIPTELWLLVHYIAGPIGFWQNLVLVGLGPRCPNCGSTNNDPVEGGSDKCFHCGDCGWVNCAKMIIGPTKNMKAIYRRNRNRNSTS